MISKGSTTFPNDLDIFRPWASRIIGWRYTVLKGSLPQSNTENIAIRAKKRTIYRFRFPKRSWCRKLPGLWNHNWTIQKLKRVATQKKTRCREHLHLEPKWSLLFQTWSWLSPWLPPWNGQSPNDQRSLLCPKLVDLQGNWRSKRDTGDPTRFVEKYTSRGFDSSNHSIFSLVHLEWWWALSFPLFQSRFLLCPSSWFTTKDEAWALWHIWNGCRCPKPCDYLDYLYIYLYNL